MSPRTHQTITKHFANLKDPRTGNATQHQLQDILVIAICASICGADTWTDVEIWGIAKQDWLRGFLELPHGIPSHDTFGRVFALLDPDEFRKGFLSWIRAIQKLTRRQVIALDGKKLRRSHDHRLGKKAIALVSAWATANHLVLGQVKVRAKSNEITAIPELLRLLEVRGCIVTIDAIGCQPKIAAKIVKKEADYVLAVKQNQGQLFEDVKDLFAGCQEEKFVHVPHDYTKTVEKGHGRIEIRECWTLAEPEFLAYLRHRDAWPKLRAVAMVRAERRIGMKRSRETRYYITSVENNAKLVLESVRAHWGIENGLHWVLDIGFREDESRVRKDHAPENMAILRHMALNLLKQEQTVKIGIKGKRLKAAWDQDYLLRVLSSG
jgi:predicted transposase YbfD/YdcC